MKRKNNNNNNIKIRKKEISNDGNENKQVVDKLTTVCIAHNIVVHLYFVFSLVRNKNSFFH